MTTAVHEISISFECGQYMLHEVHRAHCSCGGWSDVCAQLSDTQRAVEVHLRRSRREDFEGLIAQSSIGVAIADIKERGIDAHLVDLARERRARRSKSRSAKRSA